MKTISLCLIVTFCALLSFGQSRSDPDSTEGHRSSALLLHSEDSRLASPVKKKSHHTAFEGSEYNCGDYKSMRAAGISLTSLAGGITLSGTAMILLAVEDPVTKSGRERNYIALLTCGILMVAVGPGLLGPGIPLTVTGVRRCRKYCREGKQSYIRLSSRGNGLALSF